MSNCILRQKHATSACYRVMNLHHVHWIRDVLLDVGGWIALVSNPALRIAVAVCFRARLNMGSVDHCLAALDLDVSGKGTAGKRTHSQRTKSPAARRARRGRGLCQERVSPRAKQSAYENWFQMGFHRGKL